VSRRRRLTAALAPALAALATGLLVAAPAGAATLAARPAAPAQEGTTALTARLESISPWTGPSRPLRIEVSVGNRGQATLGGLQVRLFAAGQVNSRSELQQRLTSQTQAYDRFVGTQEVPGAVQIAPGATRRLPAQSFELPADLGAGHSGAVIPVRIEVTATAPSGSVDPARIDTFAIYVSEPVAQPLRMSLLVQLHEPTHRLPDGTFIDDRLAGLLAPGGALGHVVTALDQPKAPPVDLMVDALLVEEATAMSGNGWRLRKRGSAETEEVPGSDPRSKAAFSFNHDLGVLAGRAGTSLYALPYAGADLVALTRNGLAADATAQIRQGRSELEQRLGRAPDPTLAFPVDGVVDKRTMRVLGQEGVTTVVLAADQVPGAAARTRTPNAPVELASPAGQPQQALVADQALSNALADPQAVGDPAERSQRVLAETAVTWLEQPNRKEPRGILLAPPANWRPSPRQFSTLMTGFAGAPWLRVVHAERLADEVEPTSAKRRTLAPYSQRMARAELPARYLSSIKAARQRLTSFASSAGDGFDGSRELERQLLVAESADYRGGAARTRGARYVRAVNDRIRAVYGEVGIEGTPVVLTARQGPLQITAFNRSDLPLTVRLRISSGFVDATEPISEPFELPAGGGHTRRVEVRTRGPGSYPVVVELITADGREVIGTGSVMVRSTAVARVTLLLIGGAGGFLVVWWLRKVLLRRRPGGAPAPAGARRRARLPVGAGGGDSAAPVRDAGTVSVPPPARTRPGDGDGRASSDGDGRAPRQPGGPPRRPGGETDEGAEAPSRSVQP
jgi:hypothetical protein